LNSFNYIKYYKFLKILGNCKEKNTITFFENINYKNIFPSERLNIIEHVNLTAIQEFSFYTHT